MASVDNKGCVTGKSSGTAIISVCLTDSKGQECISTKSSCVVKVYGTTGIKLNSSSISLYVKDSTYISASVSGKNSKVTWKTSNSSVAAVDSNGKVTGVKAGTAKITAAVGGKKAVCTVTVKNSYTYTYAYNINDFGKFKEWNGKYTVTVTPVSSQKIKLTYKQNGKITETVTATKQSANIYTYTPKKGLYPGYKQKVTWNKKKFIIHGFEAGDGYFF